MNTTAEHVSTNSTLDPYLDYSQAKLVCTVANILNLILGLPTNGYNLLLIVSQAGGIMASEFFGLNVAVSDIFSCVCSVVQLLEFEYHISTHMLWFCFAFSHVARPLFQTCICLERYLAVVHPRVFLRFKPLRYRLACCSLVWMLVIMECGLYTLDGVSGHVFFMINLGQYLVVMSVQLYCCLSVLRALKRPGPGEGEREKEKKGGSNIKRRAFNIILLIMITMLVTHLPFIVMVSLEKYLDRANFFLGLNISGSITIMCGLVQPLLYLHRVGKLPCLNIAP